jgi:TPR repeat protein
LLYYNGQEGVPQNFVKALEYWEQAALQGHANAQYNLGVLYYGQGVPQDFVKAREYLEQAARQGHARAQSLLERM